MVEHAVQEGRVRNHEFLDACLKRNSWEARANVILNDVRDSLNRPQKNRSEGRENPNSDFSP